MAQAGSGQQAPIKVLGVDHIVLRVKDVQRSVDWYQRVLGLAPVRLAEWQVGRLDPMWWCYFLPRQRQRLHPVPSGCSLAMVQAPVGGAVLVRGASMSAQAVEMSEAVCVCGCPFA